jgi:uncharacterized membrane protein YebE (DUF533 family)
MYSDHTPIMGLQAIFEGAKSFGLSDKEAWQAVDDSLHEVGTDATVADYLHELTATLAHRILSTARDSTPSRERLSPPEERHVPSEEIL